MSRTPGRMVALGLVALMIATSCQESTCGGCVAPLAEPFPDQPRVFDGAQLRVTSTGLDFVELNLPTILDNLLENGLTFDIPPTDTNLGITIHLCQNGCQVQAEILDAFFSLVNPDTIAVNGAMNVDTIITIDSSLGHCEFPATLRDEPLDARIQFLVDPDTYFMHFDVLDLDITIENSDYDIQCPIVYDWLLELLKDFITGVLNSQLSSQLNGAIDDLVADQTCLTCDFYTAGCPAGSSCDGNGFCSDAGGCVIKPLGLIGTIGLGEMLASLDPTSDASLDVLVAPGQAQQASQRPFVRNNGLEIRMIGGAYSELNSCLPDPHPSQIPDTGIAPSMQFGNLIPGLGDDYMVGVAIADMYLDYFVYQLWRSGFLCMTIDSYGLDLISSVTLGYILPSVAVLSEGENLPVRLQMRPEGVPHVEIGEGTFNPDGTVDQPILYLFLPDLRLDFWMKLHGRWTLFLSLSQEVRLDLALEFTPDNAILPIIDQDSISVVGVEVSNHELLAESEQQLEALVPQLIEIFLPQLLGSLEAIAIPDLQGFTLDIKSLQGDVPRGAGPYHDFMTIYADLGFSPTPSPVQTQVRLDRVDSGGISIQAPEKELEYQVRIDGRWWSPFQIGPELFVRGTLLPGWHILEVRARRVGDYRSLDPDPQVVPFQIGPSAATGQSALLADPQPARRSVVADAEVPSDGERPAVGCMTTAGRLSFPFLFLLVLASLRRRR